MEWLPTYGRRKITRRVNGQPIGDHRENLTVAQTKEAECKRNQVIIQSSV